MKKEVKTARSTEKWRSPNEFLAKGKEMMLGGREPSNEIDWILLMNFFAVNAARGLEVEICKVMKVLYDIPLPYDDIEVIAKMQAGVK